MLASDGIYDIQTQALKECRKWVDALHAEFEALFNFVDARNEKSIRWLKWCGFKIYELHPTYGVEHRPFYSFVKVKSYV